MSQNKYIYVLFDTANSEEWIVSLVELICNSKVAFKISAKILEISLNATFGLPLQFNNLKYSAVK